MRRQLWPLLTVLSLMFPLVGTGCSENGEPADGQQKETPVTNAPPGSDGLDNDDDGTIDEPDEAVAGAKTPTPAGASPTEDGVDNDGDGTIDEPDEAGE